MQDYRFVSRTDVPAGRVVFEVKNAGRVIHDLALVPLPDDLPPIDRQLHSENRALAKSLAGSRALDPGSSGSFAVNLSPNARYAILCTVYDRRGRSHALRGMNAEFRTPPPRPT